jgi:DNA-binding response OmpR family regulator
VAARLRAERHDALSILIVSADAHVLSGGRTGPVYHDDYLIKPLRLPDLYDKMQLLLDLVWRFEAAVVDEVASASGH